MNFLDRTHKTSKYLQINKKISGTSPFFQYFKGKNLKILSRALLTNNFHRKNSDWNYPCWMNMQFDNESKFFSPLSYDPFLLNKTLRNWTLVGPAKFDKKCIIDPCGNLTLGKDSFSISIGIKSENGILYPKKLGDVKIEYSSKDDCFEITYADYGKQLLEIYFKKNVYFIHSKCDFDNFLIFVRPFNPEGVAPIFSIESKKDSVYINGNKVLEIPGLKKSYMSNYESGDIINLLSSQEISEKNKIECKLGSCTAAFETENSSFSIFPVKYKKIIAAKKYLPTFENSFHFSINDELLTNIYHIQRKYIDSFCANKGIVSGAFTGNEFKIDDYVYLLPALDKLGKIELVNSYLANIEYKKLPLEKLGKYVWIILNHYSISKNKQLLSLYKERIYKFLDRISVARGKTRNFLLPPNTGKYEISPIKKYIEDDLWSLAAYKLAYNIFDDDKLKRDYLSYFAVVKEDINNYCEKRKENIFFEDSIHDFTKLSYPEILYSHLNPVIVNTINLLKKEVISKGAFYNFSIEGYDLLSTIEFFNILLISEDCDSIELFENLVNFSDSTLSYPQSINPLTNGGVYGDGHYSPISAEMINFISNIFAYDRAENELHLLKISKPQWFEKEINIRNLRTRYGKISYKITIENNKYKFSTNETSAQNIYLHLPFPVIAESVQEPVKVLKIEKDKREIEFQKYEVQQ